MVGGTAGCPAAERVAAEQEQHPVGQALSTALPRRPLTTDSLAAPAVGPQDLAVSKLMIVVIRGSDRVLALVGGSRM